MGKSGLLLMMISLASSLALIPIIRKISLKLGRISLPREDRWHKSPTPTLGGVGIFLSFVVALLVYGGSSEINYWQQVAFLSGSILLFLVGVYDEFRPLSPIAKLIAQILAATLVISLGYTSTFFTPRISNPHLAQYANILLTYLWLVGITNAINLLDNMDGLAGGISLISAAVLGFFFWKEGNYPLLLVSLALVGSLIGFLIYNFPPAKIFMGDSGSLFLGFSLASLAIAHQQQASNVFAVMGVPTLIFLLPIIDTVLVTFTRLMRGQSPTQGGRDHTSHRLVAFGLSERQALMILYAVALFSAVAAAALESLNYWLSLALVPILILVMALLAAYLGRFKIVSAPSQSHQRELIARWMADLTYRRRILELILDFFLIGIAYYLAFLIAFDLQMDAQRLRLFFETLPIIFAGTYLSLVVFGVYQAVWRYVGIDDLLRSFQAAAGSVIVLAALIFGLNAIHFSPWTQMLPDTLLLYYGIFLFFALAFSRSSFRLLDTFFQQHVRMEEQSVVIVGAGDAGEMALRWILMNKQFKFRPVGFIDYDPLLVGRRIHGIRVLGTVQSLADILSKTQISGIILTEPAQINEWEAELKRICVAKGCWIRRLNLDFELLVS